MSRVSFILLALFLIIHTSNALIRDDNAQQQIVVKDPQVAIVLPDTPIIDVSPEMIEKYEIFEQLQEKYFAEKDAKEQELRKLRNILDAGDALTILIVFTIVLLWILCILYICSAPYNAPSNAYYSVLPIRVKVRVVDNIA